MADSFHRNLGLVENLEMGEWTDRTASGHPVICCKRCGTIAELGDEYKKDPEGRVSHAWCCPGCPFFDYVHLNSYGDR